MKKAKSEDYKTEEYLRRKEDARKQRDEYIPRAIKKLQQLVSQEKIEAYCDKIPFDQALRKAEEILAKHGVRKDSAYYDSCISDAGLVYIYTIHRCAYCGYDRFWGYYYLMIRIVIIWNYYLRDDVKAICMKNKFKLIYLDSEKVNL